ncbi:YfjI family protein [Yersinia kristensenii]|uniref:YfjI family protein n=1 Tax=Yersinia kristensenii TaxID=28152 RepID=UPI001C60FF80|nr:YfjI family protein [Yersinia kristensenii]MBW5813342.1 DUF3987 domain-containing protein [Yersinia kristensenii]MBW5830651.1 DUF3987 domain-containing protein [Yersinia kristensenii]
MSENEFPTGMLPLSMQEVISEVRNLTQAPVSMIAVTALSVIALACQGSIDVRRMEGLVGPTSLYFIIKALSGERKSTVEKVLMSAIYQFEQEQHEIYKKNVETYNQEMEIFKVRKKALLSELRVNTRKCRDTSDVVEQLSELHRSYPNSPVRYKLIFNDVTPAAMKEYLCGDYNSVGLMSHEAGSVFDSHAFRDLPFMNQMWDGSTVSVQRKNADEILIKNARLTLSLMTQPKPFNKFIMRNDEEARGNGFLARSLICEPGSTQGYRLIENQNTSTENLKSFQNRLMEIIKKSTEILNSGEKKCLRFTNDAEKLWIKFHNDTEVETRDTGLLADFKDYASKMADNMARIAALLHYFWGYPGDISLDAVISARAICLWFGDEHIRLFSKSGEQKLIMNDENELWEWINNYCNQNLVKTGKPYMKKNTILQLGPNRFRDKTTLDNTLTALLLNGRVQVGKEGRTTIVKPKMIYKTPAELLQGLDL